MQRTLIDEHRSLTFLAVAAQLLQHGASVLILIIMSVKKAIAYGSC
jgi:hypothetical protein